MIKSSGSYEFSNWKTLISISESGELPLLDETRADDIVKKFADITGVELGGSKKLYTQGSLSGIQLSFNYRDNLMELKITNGCPENKYKNVTKSSALPDDLNQRVVIETSIAPPKATSIRGNINDFLRHTGFFYINDFKLSDADLEEFTDEVVERYVAEK